MFSEKEYNQSIEDMRMAARELRANRPTSWDQRLAAYLQGMLEFRQSITTSYEEYELMDAYDAGRDMAHRLTFRIWDRW